MSGVLQKLKETGTTSVQARIVNTDANSMARNLYQRCGFTPASDGVWTRNLNDLSHSPVHIDWSWN